MSIGWFEHVNIVKFYDAKFVQRSNKSKEELWIEMEYANWGNLFSLLRNHREQKKYIEEKAILKYFAQICLGLKEIHSKKIVHRDIKSLNIFLDDKDTIKIGDFGSSRMIQDSLQNMDTLIGTVFYMAPEVIKNNYGLKADIWSLGVLLYELWALKFPVIGGSIHEIMLNIWKMKKMDSIPSHFSQEISSLVESLLQYDPDRRPTVDDIIRTPLVTDAIAELIETHPRKEEFIKLIETFDSKVQKADKWDDLPEEYFNYETMGKQLNLQIPVARTYPQEFLFWEKGNNKIVRVPKKVLNKEHDKEKISKKRKRDAVELDSIYDVDITFRDIDLVIIDYRTKHFSPKQTQKRVTIEEEEWGTTYRGIVK